MWYFRILFVLSLICLAFAKNKKGCPKMLSVNISDGTPLRNGSILKDNVIYPSHKYYYESDKSVWGCICKIKTCIRKCCPGNRAMAKMNGTYICTGATDTDQNLVFYNLTQPTKVSESDIHIIYNKSCPKSTVGYTEDDNQFYLQANGVVFVSGGYEYPDKFYSPEYYCLKVIGKRRLATICEADEPVSDCWEQLVGMIVSMPFLLATFVVYAILPDSNLHRKGLMSYVMTLLIAYIFLVIVQLTETTFSESVCASLGYTVIFFFMVSFFWMNVMCIDMWLVFSGLRGFGKRNTERKRFILYCIYAWGVPMFHVLIVYLINSYGDKEGIYYPGIGIGKCFLQDGYPNLFYFYGPMGIVITINIALFILTAIKIQKVKKETSMLKHSDSKRHSYEDDTQKFNLYVKLLFAMGINWTMEIVSWAVNWKMGESVPAYVWYLTDFCNALYGAFIFFIFVFKKKIWKTLQKRYYVFIGKPHLAHSLTTTHTTRSSNYSTTETGLSEHRLTELRNGRGEERALAQH